MMAYAIVSLVHFHVDDDNDEMRWRFCFSNAILLLFYVNVKSSSFTYPLRLHRKSCSTRKRLVIFFKRC